MDEEFHELEAELKRLQPCGPSARVVTRIAAQLSAPVVVEIDAWRRWIWWATLPVAAAIALLLARITSLPPTNQPSTIPAEPSPLSPATMKPVTAENILLSARDEGLVTLEDGTRARRERLEFLDTITWKNPQTNASLTWRVPREEVRFVPVAFH